MEKNESARFYSRLEEQATEFMPGASQLLEQAKRPEELVINFPGDAQSLVSLIAPHGDPRFIAEIASIVSHIIPVFLQCPLDLAHGRYPAMTVIRGIAGIVVGLFTGAGASLDRLSQADDCEGNKTEQGESFHIQRYDRAVIAQDHGSGERDSILFGSRGCERGRFKSSGRDLIRRVLWMLSESLFLRPDNLS